MYQQHFSLLWGALKMLLPSLPSSLSSAFSFSFLYVSAFQNCHPLTVEHSNKVLSLKPHVAIRNVLTTAAGVADGEAENGLFCDQKTPLN